MVAKETRDFSSDPSSIVVLSPQESELARNVANKLNLDHVGQTYKGRYGDLSSITRINPIDIQRIKNGATTVVFASYADDANLMITLRTLGIAREANPQGIRIVASGIAPVQREDRQKPEDPEGTFNAAGHAALLMRASGATHILTMEAHNPKAYRPSITNIGTSRLLAAHAAPYLLEEDRPVYLAAPDYSAIPQTQAVGRRLREKGVPMKGTVYFDKDRSAEGTVTTGAMHGEKPGKDAVVLGVDDIGSSLTTMGNIIERLQRKMFIGLTHGTFTDQALRWLPNAPVSMTFVTNSIPQMPMKTAMAAAGKSDRFVVMPIEGLFADAIMRIHQGQSLAGLSIGKRKSS